MLLSVTTIINLEFKRKGEKGRRGARNGNNNTHGSIINLKRRFNESFFYRSIQDLGHRNLEGERIPM